MAFVLEMDRADADLASKPRQGNERGFLVAIAMLKKPLDVASSFDAQRVGIQSIQGRAVLGMLVEKEHGSTVLRR